MSGFVNFGVRASQKTETRDFNFTGGTLDGATFDRSSTATYLSDSTGFITDAAIDEARWERKSGTLCLMVEPQRTNLSLNSQDFSLWGKDNLTFNVDAVAGPDNQLTADGIVATAVNTFHRLVESYTVGTTTPYSISFFARAGDVNYIDIREIIYDGSFRNASSFDINAGSVVYTTAAYPTTNIVSPVANSFYRCSTSFTTDTGSGAVVYFVLADSITTGDGISSFLGSGGNSNYMWGAQFEEGAQPTSYIPAGASSATRAQDQLTVDVPVGETTLQLTFDDDSTQNIDVTADAGSTHTIDPDVLNRFHIKYGDFV